jgi:hypothetical protein
LFSLGCSGEEEVVNASPVVKTAVKKPKPKVKAIVQLIDEFSIDNRIHLDELEAPRVEKSRVVLLQFFDALLKCDAASLKNLISAGDRIELEAMINAGLSEQMNTVTRLDLKIGLDPSGSDCVMGVFEIGMHYQVQLWRFQFDGQKSTFTSMPTQPNLVNTLSGNWIKSYFALIDKQEQIALQPDAGSSYILAGGMDQKTEQGSQGDGPGAPPSRPGGPVTPGH